MMSNIDTVLSSRVMTDHRRTRRRGAWGVEAPSVLEKFQGKLCFQGKRKLLKNPE